MIDTRQPQKYETQQYYLQYKHLLPQLPQQQLEKLIQNWPRFVENKLLPEIRALLLTPESFTIALNTKQLAKTKNTYEDLLKELSSIISQLSSGNETFTNLIFQIIIYNIYENTTAKKEETNQPYTKKPKTRRQKGRKTSKYPYDSIPKTKQYYLQYKHLLPQLPQQQLEKLIQNWPRFVENKLLPEIRALLLTPESFTIALNTKQLAKTKNTYEDLLKELISIISQFSSENETFTNLIFQIIIYNIYENTTAKRRNQKKKRNLQGINPERKQRMPLPAKIIIILGNMYILLTLAKIIAAYRHSTKPPPSRTPIKSTDFPSNTPIFPTYTPVTPHQTPTLKPSPTPEKQRKIIIQTDADVDPEYIEISKKIQYLSYPLENSNVAPISISDLINQRGGLHIETLQKVPQPYYKYNLGQIFQKWAQKGHLVILTTKEAKTPSRGKYPLFILNFKDGVHVKVPPQNTPKSRIDPIYIIKFSNIPPSEEELIIAAAIMRTLGFNDGGYNACNDPNIGSLSDPLKRSKNPNVQFLHISSPRDYFFMGGPGITYEEGKELAEKLIEALYNTTK